MAQSDKPKPPSLKQQAEQLRRELQVQLSSPSPSPSQPAIQQPWTAAQEYLNLAVARQRSELILEQWIIHYVKRGYRLTARSDASAQLVQPKKFSSFWAMFLLVFSLGTLLPIYIIYYLSKKERAIYLSITPAGTIQTVRRGPLFSLWGWIALAAAAMLGLVIISRLIDLLRRVT
jgi:hypothetical protein